MKHSIEKKKEPDEYPGKVNEENKSTRVKRKPAETSPWLVSSPAIPSVFINCSVRTPTRE